MKNGKNNRYRFPLRGRPWFVFVVLTFFPLSYGAGFHRHSHVPLSNHSVNEGHIHQADFYVAILGDEYQGDPDDKWAQVDAVESGIAKKSLDHADSLVLLIFAVVFFLLVRRFGSRTTYRCLSHKRVLRYAVPALRGPPV